MSNPRYTILAASKGSRLVRNSDLGTAEVVTTIADADRARRTALELSCEYEQGDALLAVDAAAAGPRATQSRRRMLAAFDEAASRPDAVASTPDPATHAARFGRQLGRAVRGEQPPVQRAVREEAAALYDGLDDVLVVATASSAYGNRAPGQAVINHFLAAASDDELEWLATTGRTGDPGTAFELLEAYENTLAEDIAPDELDTVDVRVDAAALAAWLSLNRPELSELAAGLKHSATT